MNNDNNNLINNIFNEAYCYVIDSQGNLLSKIISNKGWVYLRKQKASFFNKIPFLNLFFPNKYIFNVILLIQFTFYENLSMIKE